MKRNILSIFLIIPLVLLICTNSICVSAETISDYKEIRPIDLVIVMDKSGSMNSSDPKQMTSAAVNMLVNMMPAEESRVGVIAFNNQPQVLTTVNGSASMIPLKDIGNVDNIQSEVSGVQYQGATGIGNALIAATDLLSKESDKDHQKVILLFTDGLNDFGSDEEGLALCEDNEASAVLWAKDNECPIYCFGYDYKLSDGSSSMGANGEGLNKLTNISNITGGNTVRIEDINTIQEEFIKMLADLCDLIYIDVATVPGDGNQHEVQFEVSPSVIEADIRIGSITENAVSNGSIKLYDPSGTEIALRNEANVRFDIDSLAASIKVIRPTTGKWTLVLDGIVGDDIKIGLLQHYRVDIGASLELPAGNPSGVAFTNDEIMVNAWLVEDGEKITDLNLYDTITKASATYVPRAHSDNVQTISLTRDDLGFTGKFVIEEECIYDVTVKIESGSFYREDTLTIKSNNHPLELVSDIDTVEVNKGKTVSIEDIYSHVYDQEGDKITAEVTLVGDPDTANVTVNGDNLSVEGLLWKSTYATVTFKDAQGNTVETTFKIQVHNPVVVISAAAIIALVIAGVILLALIGYRASYKIKGYVTILTLRKVDLNNDHDEVEVIFRDENSEEDYDDDAISTDFACKLNIYGIFGRNKNIFVIAKKFVEAYEEYLRNNNPDMENEKDNSITECIETFFTDLDKFELIGTAGGLKGFVIKLPKKSCKVYMESYKNKKGKVKINTYPKTLSFVAPLEDEDGDKKYAYEFKFKYTKK